MRVKTLMGLERFYVRFFVGEKFTKINLALNRVGENRSKLAWRVFMMFRTIWRREFFRVKSLMGTPLDLKIFRRKKKIQLQVRGQEGIKIKICFSTIKDLPKWENTNISIFVCQHSYGYTEIRSSFEVEKSRFWSCFKSAENRATSSLREGGHR